MRFSGLCILSSMGAWLEAGKNVVLQLRVFSRKPSSDGQVFLDFLAQEVLWCHQRCEQIFADEMRLGYDFISYVCLNDSHPHDSVGLCSNLRAECASSVCLHATNSCRANTYSAERVCRMPLCWIRLLPRGRNAGMQRIQKIHRSENNAEMSWDELRWVVKRTSEKVKYYPVGLSRKDSDKKWTITIEAANPAKFTKVIDSTKVVDLWWFFLGT